MDPLVDAQRAAVKAVRDQVTQFVETVWKSISPDDQGALELRYLTRVIPMVKAGQIQVAQITNAYLLAQAKELGIYMGNSTVDPDAVTGLRPVSYEQEYLRPITETRVGLADGKSADEARQSGLTRLKSLAQTDLQMAYTLQALRTMAGWPGKYYVRQPSGPKTCALCLVASTQRYHRSQLMPIHPGCDCGVKMVRSDYDPGQVLDRDQLDRIHAMVADKTGTAAGSWTVYGGRDAKSLVDYRELLAVREHGEYGPTLTWRTQHFTGPDAIPGN